MYVCYGLCNLDIATASIHYRIHGSMKHETVAVEKKESSKKVGCPKHSYRPSTLLHIGPLNRASFFSMAALQHTHTHTHGRLSRFHTIPFPLDAPNSPCEFNYLILFFQSILCKADNSGGFMTTVNLISIGFQLNVFTAFATTTNVYILNFFLCLFFFYSFWSKNAFHSKFGENLKWIFDKRIRC